MRILGRPRIDWCSSLTTPGACVDDRRDGRRHAGGRGSSPRHGRRGHRLVGGRTRAARRRRPGISARSSSCSCCWSAVWAGVVAPRRPRRDGGDRCARRLHAVELPLDRVGDGARRRVGRRQPDAAVPHRVRALRAAAVAVVGSGRLPRRLRRRHGAGGVGGRGGGGLGGADSAFEDGRLAAPMGYENASAGLFLAAFWPAVMLAARPRSAGVARGALLAAARRAARARRAVPEPRLAARGGRGARARGRARRGSGARLLLALVVVGAAAVADAAVPARRLRRRRAGSAHGARPAAVAIARPRRAARCRRRRGAPARAPHAPAGPRAARSCSRSPALSSSPARGAVVARRGRHALRRRRGRRAATTSGASPGPARRGTRCRAPAPTTSPTTMRASGAAREEPLYPHSIEWRTLGQTGLVGRVAARRLLRGRLAGRRRGASTARTAVAVAALVSAAAWLAHATIDWLWELPALGAPAMALPRARRRPAGTAPRARRRRGGRGLARRAGGGRVAAASYALPGAGGAGDRARRARVGRDPAPRCRGSSGRATLEPAERPRRRHRRHARARATATSRRADAPSAARVARDPDDWYAQTQLGAVDSGGRRAAAIAALTRARRLNPNEPAIALALDAVRRAAAPADVEARLATRRARPVGRHPSTAGRCSGSARMPEGPATR